MTELERKLNDTLRRLALPDNSQVLLGVSGGADSMALLDALCRLRLQGHWSGEIYSAHVNHRLRGAESDGDEKMIEEWAREWTQTYKLPLPTVSTDVDVAKKARETGQNLEAIARQVRYDFFRWFAQSYHVPLVFTAHTDDDQVETLVMRWLRGTGATGLRGIHEISELCAGVQLVRPLLDVTRVEVLEHCAHYGVTYRTDSSNLTDAYTRNRVRHQLLPLLCSFNPQFGVALQRGAALWQADAECLGEQAEALLMKLSEGDRLTTRELVEMHSAIRGRVLRAWVQQVRGTLHQLSAKHWQALERLVATGQSGRTLELPRGWRVTREFDQLRLWQATDGLPVKPTPICLVAGTEQAFGDYVFTVSEPITWAVAARLSAEHPARAIALPVDVVSQALWLRTRLPGDAYVPARRGSPVKLKSLLIRHKIPVSQRAAHPLLVTAAGEIIWSPQLPVARGFQFACETDDQAPCILVIARERCNLPLVVGVMSDASTDASN